MLLSLLMCVGAAAPQATPAQDAIHGVRAALERVHSRWAEDDVLGALEQGARGLRLGAAALPQVVHVDDASELADELELLSVYLATFVTATISDGHVSRSLEGVEIPPRHGMAHAALAHLRDQDEQLGYLGDWEFIGPFDNERGAGMARALAPESAPDATLEHEGALRPVSWRRLPEGLRASMRLRFGALLDPSNQVCLLARTWVKVDQELDVLALLGAGDELRLWHDGEAAFDALGEHSFRVDALAAPLRLHAGWNELAVKLGSRDGAPLFSARLVDATSGAPLALECTGTAPPGVLPAPLAEGSAPVLDPARRPGAWARNARLAEDADSAEAQWRLALLAMARQPAPESESPGRLHAARAVGLAPELLRYRTLRAIVMNDAASTRAERDAAAWLGTVRAVRAIDPGLPRALVWEALHAFREQGMPQRALELVELARLRAPHSLSLGSLRAELLRSLDQPALAQAEARALLARTEAVLQPALCLDLLERVPVPAAERAARLEELLAEESGARVLRLTHEQRALSSANVASEWSMELYRALVERDPWSVQTRLTSARLLLVQDRPSEALALLDEALELAPERAVLERYRARAHLQRGDHEAAIDALERQLELDYSATDERRLLEHLRENLGAPFHEAYAEPLADVLARAGTRHPGASRELLLRRLVIEVQPDGTAKRYQREVHRVNTEIGARDLDRFVLRARAGTQEVRLLSARVQHPDGAVEEARTGRSGRSGRLPVDLPPISAGDLVDLEWRLDDLRPSFFGRTFGLRTSFVGNADLPLNESEVVLLSSPELPLYHQLRNVELEPMVEALEGGRTRTRWTLTNWTPRRRESPMPPTLEWMPILEVSSYADWQALGAWWWDLIEEEIRVSNEMSAFVAELTGELATPIEKLRALYDFVVTDVRYNAWEFGVHGYQPYSAPVIFSRRFGDCKDKAILLRALLSEVDIECFPVLIDSQQVRAAEDHGLALVQHFNHVIAWVPEQEGIPAMYLDGTARLHPLEVLPASDLGAAVVIVRPDGVQEARIPFPPAEFNQLSLDIEVDLATSGPSPTVIERRARGTFDPSERRLWAGGEQERAEVAERIAGDLYGALDGATTVQTSRVEELSGETWARIECAPETIGRASEGGFELPVVPSRMDFFGSLAAESARSMDLVLSAPSVYERRLVYRLPEGAGVEELPPAVAHENEDASYTWSASLEAGALTIVERFSMKTQRVPPDRYPALRELLRELEATQSASIHVELQP